jgi:hypothetical protein
VATNLNCSEFKVQLRFKYVNERGKNITGKMLCKGMETTLSTYVKLGSGKISSIYRL